LQTRELNATMDAHGFAMPACPSCGAPVGQGDMRAKCIESIERVQESDALVRLATMRIGCRACLPTPEADELEQIDADFDDEEPGQDAAAAYILTRVVCRRYRDELADLPLHLREPIDRAIEAMRCAGEGRQHE
jgi:hypothetical protein